MMTKDKIPHEPDIDFCSKCHEHTGWEWDEDGEEWLSVCCGAGEVEMP